MQSLTFPRALTTLSRCSCVALERTDTLAFGANLSLRTIVSSIIPSKLGCRVGSPLPAKVIALGSMPASLISFSLSCKLLYISSLEGSLELLRG